MMTDKGFKKEEKMKEILCIDVILDQIQTVRGAAGEVTMVLFHGTFFCEAGTGKILPGGVDTQIEKKGKKSLSARYMLEGEDKNQKKFCIFVENNGECKGDGPVETHPVIYTDSEELQWMEKEKLTGTVENNGENRVRIKLYAVTA